LLAAVAVAVPLGGELTLLPGKTVNGRSKMGKSAQRKQKAVFYFVLAIILMLVTPYAITADEYGAVSSSSSQASWKEKLFSWKNDIDYSSPSKYLEAGSLTNLSMANYAHIEATIPREDIDGKNWRLVNGIYAYINNPTNFKNRAAGGALIAKRTVDQIFTDQTLTGCHDWGIVLAASLRSFGIPAIYVDTASVSWATERSAGNANIPFEGHIFVEAWIQNRWVILNSTTPEAVIEYDYSNSLLGFKVYKSNQYYAMFKGLDPIDYGIRGNEDITAAMIAASRIIADESKLLTASPAPSSILSLIGNSSGPAKGRLLIVGDKVPVEYVAGKIGSRFAEKRMVGFSSIKSSDLSYYDSIVCLYDISKPDQLPGFLVDRFPAMKEDRLIPGQYRYEDGSTVVILICQNGVDSLIAEAELLGIELFLR
jgi:hypothetical protein